MKITIEIGHESTLSNQQKRALAELVTDFQLSSEPPGTPTPLGEFVASVTEGLTEGLDVAVGGTSSEDADERVREDWTAVDAGGEAPPIVASGIPATIKRADVVLKVGDLVRLRGDNPCDIASEVTGVIRNTIYPIIINGNAYTLTGLYYHDEPYEDDVVEVNGVRIVDDAEG